MLSTVCYVLLPLCVKCFIYIFNLRICVYGMVYSVCVAQIFTSLMECYHINDAFVYNISSVRVYFYCCPFSTFCQYFQIFISYVRSVLENAWINRKFLFVYTFNIVKHAHKAHLFYDLMVYTEFYTIIWSCFHNHNNILV